jgi:hypothetical protein
LCVPPPLRLALQNNNCDAEGRLILADALHDGAGDGPDLLVDVATLTGAARAALGSELPAMFCSCDETAAQLLKAADAEVGAVGCCQCPWRHPRVLHAACHVVTCGAFCVRGCEEGGPTM